MKLSAKNICKTYDTNFVIRDFSCAYSTGDFIGIFGKNGSGKSTLIKLLSQMILPDSGEIETIPPSPGKYIVAPYSNLYANLSIKEHAGFIARAYETKFDKALYLDLLKKLNLENFDNQIVKKLSSGTVQKAKIMLSLLSQSDILFFDEPFSNLDDAGISTTIELIRQARTNSLILMASNNIDDLAECNVVINI